MFFEVKELCRSFGALQAVHNVSFTLDEGTTLSIIGPNGAGKTTLFYPLQRDHRRVPAGQR